MQDMFQDKDMTQPNENTSPVQELDIVTDDTSIYQGGNLIRVNIEDLIYNEVAIRQLINTLNTEKRINEKKQTHN